MKIIPAIYPITDTCLSGLSHAEQVDRLASAGASLVQIREKTASGREFAAAAAAALDIAKRRGVKILINDRVDIALVTQADGVHLGQDDLPPRKAREILGDDAIIGYSTHTLGQVAVAASLPIDYIAFGPIFPTPTKLNPAEIVGTSGLRRIHELAGGLPVVAIGGIDDQNISEVFAAGADAAAVISYILSDAGMIERRFKRLLQIAQND